MAPIVSSSRTKSSFDNNTSDHAALEKSGSAGNNRVRSTLSREKVTTSSNSSGAVVKKGAEEPAKKASPSARSSSSAGSSSRAQATAMKSTTATSKQPAKPETTSNTRKEISKNAGASGSVTTSDTPAVKAVKSHPLPSTVMNKHKQAAVFTSGKKKHKTYALSYQ